MLIRNMRLRKHDIPTTGITKQHCCLAASHLREEKNIVTLDPAQGSKIKASRKILHPQLGRADTLVSKSDTEKQEIWKMNTRT